MSKKQARNKKLADVEVSLAEQQKATAAQGPKVLIMTPQIPVAIHGTYPEQYLVVEQPNASGSRKKVRLTPENAYNILLEILMEKAGEIELEHQLAAERKQSAPRRKAQPDWRTIAVHPEAVIIERLPTRSPQITSNKSDLSLEDMGL